MASIIKAWQLTFIWDDGTEHEVANHVPTHLAKAIENFSDYWEENYNDDDEEELEDEEDLVHPSFDPVFKNER